VSDTFGCYLVSGILHRDHFAGLYSSALSFGLTCVCLQKHIHTRSKASQPAERWTL